MGDAFNMLNALFAGLAFVAIIFQLWLQQSQIEDEKNARLRAERISTLAALSQMAYQKIIYERELLIQIAPGFKNVSFLHPGDKERVGFAFEVRQTNIMSLKQLIDELNKPRPHGLQVGGDTSSLVKDLRDNETSVPMLQQIYWLTTQLEKYEAELERLIEEST